MANIQQVDGILFGGAQPLSERPLLTFSGTSLVMTLGNGAAGGSLGIPLSGNRVNLTSTVAATLFTVTNAAGTGAGGKVAYAIFASDGTDHQVRTASATWAIVNKAGTNTSDVDIDTATSIAASTGTLTATLAWSVAAPAAPALQITATTSLTATTLYVVYTLTNDSLYAITLAGTGV